MRPFCAIYSTFLQRGFDQVAHDVCIQSLPVIFGMDRAGLVGADGATHHGVFDIAFLRSLPNIVLMAPKDEVELRDMMYTSVDYLKGPIAIRYPRGNGTGADLTKPPRLVPIGKGEILREGAPPNGLPAIALCGVGPTVGFCLKAADILTKEHGIQPTVVNARFIKPLDGELFDNLARRNQLIVTVEDHAIIGGFGSAVVEQVSDSDLAGNCSVLRLGIPDKFIDHGTQDQLYKLCGFDVQSIVKAVVEKIGAVKTKFAANS